jgi:hypothetical protein
VRRPSVLLVLLALTVLMGSGPTLPTLASSSAATRASQTVICPVAAGAPGPINCCGPPIVRVGAALPPIDCCPTIAALCPQTLTIASKPNPSTADRQVVVSGQLLGAATVGVTVELWQALAGQAQFTQVAKTTTDASGAYAITRGARQVQTDREWYVTAATMRSRTMAQAVHAVVTLAAIAGKHGTTIFAGHVSPSHKGERILLERHTSQGWRTIARPLLTRASTFRVRHRLGRGTAVLHAVLPADARNALSASALLTVRSR